MQAWACGNLRCAEGRHSEALRYLGEALYVEVVKDGLSVSEMTKLLDQILVSVHECNESVPRCAGTVERALLTLVEDSRWQELEDSFDLAVLAHKMALFFVAARLGGERSLGVAARYNERALDVLRRCPDETEVLKWLTQVEALHTAVFHNTAATSTL